MLRMTVPALVLAGLLSSLAATQDRAPQPGVVPQQGAAGKEDTGPIGKFLQEYVETFDKNQAEAVAAFWSPKCVYVDRETGQRTEGRAGIRSDLEKLFKENPGAKISVEMTSVRFVRPDVATVEGTSTAFLPKLDPTTTQFSAIFVKEGENWLIDSVQETSVPKGPAAGDALKELEWLVGDWVDDSPGISVECSVQWAANHSFLVRSYKVKRDNEDPWEGTQIIGWDPRSKQIHSWTFDSDGSFDEGDWTKRGDNWSVTLTRTLEDGGTATGTQIIKKQSPDAYTVQMVAREVNGEPVPSSDPIKVVRVIKKPGDIKPGESKSGEAK